MLILLFRVSVCLYLREWYVIERKVQKGSEVQLTYSCLCTSSSCVILNSSSNFSECLFTKKKSDSKAFLWSLNWLIYFLTLLWSRYELVAN